MVLDRLRGALHVVGAVFAHLRAARGRHVAGGVLMADAAGYETASGALLGGFYDGIAADVARGASAGARVLEIGCGPGHLSSRLARDHGLVVVGVDLDAAMLEKARAHAARLEGASPPTFIVGDAAALPFAAGSFDLVISTLSLHHWDDPSAALREIARVLRPEGRALIWDLRSGRAAMHAGIPDPAALAAGTGLRVLRDSPWRWPWRLSFTRRVELARDLLS